MSFENLLYLILIAITFIGAYNMFEKAGIAGWKAIVPVYNIFLALKIAKLNWIYIILFLFPIVSQVMYVILLYNIAKVFGKGIGTFIGLLLLPYIFIPYLGFGDAEYNFIS